MKFTKNRVLKEVLREADLHMEEGARPHGEPQYLPWEQLVESLSLQSEPDRNALADLAELVRKEEDDLKLAMTVLTSGWPLARIASRLMRLGLKGVI